jgi:hypothetical protein
MADQRITKRVVDSLRPKPSEYTVWDAKLPGFGVRVRPSGAMSYIVVYRAGSGRGAPFRRFTLATVGKVAPEKARKRTCCSSSQPSHHAGSRRDLYHAAASATGCL